MFETLKLEYAHQTQVPPCTKSLKLQYTQWTHESRNCPTHDQQTHHHISISTLHNKLLLQFHIFFSCLLQLLLSPYKSILSGFFQLLLLHNTKHGFFINPQEIFLQVVGLYKQGFITEQFFLEGLIL